MQHYNLEMYVHVPNKISMGSPTIYLLWLFSSYKKTAKYYLPLWSSLALETNFSLSKMADDCQQLCINNNKCSFSAFSTISCGFSTHFTSEKDYVQVSKCQKDIGGHLRSLKLAQDNIPSEGHLLLYRIGFFVNITNNFLVCPNHRAKLGIKWKRQSVKCSFPDHTGQGKSERSITPQMSSFILSHKGVLLPVGSGKIVVDWNVRGIIILTM